MAGDILITTLTTGAVAPPDPDATMCDKRRVCEGVHTVAGRPGEYYVIVTEVTDPSILAAFAPRVGPGERLGRVERRIIDEVPR